MAADSIQVAFSRHLLKYPWQLSLALIGISVGVTVVVAIQLVRVSAFDSFERASLLNTGYFSHRIEPTGPEPIAYATFVALKKQFPFTPISPVVSFKAVTTDVNEQQSVYMLGFDPISRRAVSSDADNPEIDIEKFLGEKNFALL
ncbi:MAG: ABC transporter permease, partial [Gammaproteobacteria bacterium]